MRASCHVGAWTPLVTLMIGAAPSTSFHISRAVSPWSAATPFARRDRRRPATVIENGSPPISSSSASVKPRSASILRMSVEVVDLVARGHRRVGREHDVRAQAARAARRARAAERLAAQQLEAREHRVALVEVIDVDLLAERVEQAHAADAEHDLLGEPVLDAAAVEPLGDPAVLVALGLEQVERRCDVALDLPGAARHLLAADRDLDRDVDDAAARRAGSWGTGPRWHRRAPTTWRV